MLFRSLVAFPTETVYGLGANALNEEAARKTYEAKGRPSDNPLIVHIADIQALDEIVEFIPEKAKSIVEKFWPGPLTLIFEKSGVVPLGTTGGLQTVAVRMPEDEIARALIRAGGGYISAPSANTSGRPSPTSAEHVAEDLDGKIDMIMMRLTEIIGSFPEIVVVTLFILFFGTGILSIILCLVVQNWIGTARMIRSQFYRYKGSEYVLAARTLGVKDMALIFRHILPNSIGPIITRAMIAIPGAIFTESFLAYIGLGIRAPESSIGVLLSHKPGCIIGLPL